MKFLKIEHILELHALVVQTTGGGKGIRDLGRIESAVATQNQSVFGDELYTSVYDKSAALIRSIIADRPFIDGDKRTAMLVGLTFLKINNQIFNAKSGEIENFAVEIAVNNLDVLQISQWLKNHTKS